MKAVVLAAGEGKRLRPLTEVRPKPMVPVANRPVLEYVVEALGDAGLDEIVFVVGYKRDRIRTYFGDGDDWEVDIEYVVQEKQLGTGHALLQAEEAVEDEFLVLNGDSAVDTSLIRTMVGQEGTSVGVTNAENPSDYGVVKIEDGRVTNIVEKPVTGTAERETVNNGVYRFEPSVFDEITQGDGYASLVDVLAERASDGGVTAVRTENWTDVSHLWDILSVNARMVDGTDDGATVHPTAHVADDVALGKDTRVGPNATVFPGTALGDNTVVGAGAVVGNSVVFADSRVGEGAVVRDCVVAEGVEVGPNVTVEGGEADVVVEGELHENVRLGGVVGDRTTLRGGAQLEPGTVVGVESDVGTGAKITGRVDSGTVVRR